MIADLRGQHAVVTGGGRGIGAAIAHALAAQGVHVTLMGRTISALEATADAITHAYKTRVHIESCDVTRPDDVSRAFDGAVRALGWVQILINNAGHAIAATSFEAIALDTWHDLIAVNLTGTLLCTQQVLPAMIAAGSGRIINIASTAGLKGYAGLAPYCATKHGIVGLTRALAAETARTGITANAVCPSYTEGTDMFAYAVDNVMRAKGVSADEARSLLSKKSPRRTPITLNEVADTVLWLCSPAASAITGQAIAVAAGEVQG
jgi:NAD(P)-dependent dehydrogenase (short-subunit alcohol dehydrogenase family)